MPPMTLTETVLLEVFLWALFGAWMIISNRMLYDDPVFDTRKEKKPKKKVS